MFFSHQKSFRIDPTDHVFRMTNKRGNRMSPRIMFAVAFGVAVMSSGVAFAQTGGTGGTVGGGNAGSTGGTVSGHGMGGTGSGTQYNNTTRSQGSMGGNSGMSSGGNSAGNSSGTASGTSGMGSTGTGAASNGSGTAGGAGGAGK
jgi:hypothetical protein